MKNLSIEEATVLLSEIGHQANVSAFKKDEYDQEKKVTVLNNGFCWDLDGASLGGANNDLNAETALEQIMNSEERKFEVYSSYFNYAIGTYSIS